MAALGDIGKTFNLGFAWNASKFYMQDKEPSPVVMINTAFPSAIPFSYAVLTRNCCFQDRVLVNVSGIWTFFDMDDSGDQVYAISTYTQTGPTGEDWSATVVGNVVVVTQLHAANRAVATAFA